MGTKTSYSFFELIVYLYIGKIEKAHNWLQPVVGGVKAKRFTCLIPSGAKLAILFGPCKFGGGFLRIKLFSNGKYLIL